MKKIAFCLLLAALCLPAALAEASVFADVVGDYDFCSGAGAWSTDLTITADGTFSGSYHDTDFDEGELDGVPYEAVTVLIGFTGRISAPQHSSAQELVSTVTELTLDPFEPFVDEGVLFTPAPEAYGIAQGDTLRFFMQGAYVEALPEDLWNWLVSKEGGPDWETLPYVAMYNETGAAGYSGPVRGGETPASGGWLFFDAPAATEAPARLTFPVDAEVVNCKQCVSLRAQPSTKAALLAEVPLGEVVQVFSNTGYLGNDRWFVDAAYNGLRGYICIEYLDVILPESVRYNRDYLWGTEGSISAVNPGTDLIMRAGPGSDYEAVGLLFGGEVLGYLGDARKDGAGTCWYHASYYGDECWISAKYTALTLNDGTTYTGSGGVL